MCALRILERSTTAHSSTAPVNLISMDGFLRPMAPTLSPYQHAYPRVCYEPKRRRTEFLRQVTCHG